MAERFVFDHCRGSNPAMHDSCPREVSAAGMVVAVCSCSCHAGPRVRRAACPSCPYRLDVPSGVWHPDEYAKLPPYDEPTAEQPLAAFCCHASPDEFCHGWAVVGSSRGAEFDLLALRLATIVAGQRIEVPAPSVPLFASGAEAAAHGLADVLAPGDDADRVRDRLVRAYPRLRPEDSL